MVNKESLKKHALKATATYDKHATVHRYIASSLISLVGKEHYKTVLEIGSGTGILTQFLKEKVECDTLYLNDIAEFPHVNLLGDMDYMDIPKRCNLVVSSSTLHWSEDLEKLIKKIHKNLRNNGEFVFSLFIEGNLEETAHFNESLKYHTFDEICEILSKRFLVKLSYTESIEKRFPSPLEALKEFRNLGIIGESGKVSVGKIKSFKETKLTYQTAYFVVRKEKKFSFKKLAIKPLSAIRKRISLKKTDGEGQEESLT